MPSCRRWSGCGCRCRWAVRRTTFARAALVEAGAWDPFNVTEDADLGIRLARQKLRTSVLACTTWEEAPVDLATWLKQRTRWLKGWMQTYLVHTRSPGGSTQSSAGAAPWVFMR